MSPEISVIIPMYNEEDTIYRLISDTDRALGKERQGHEILVVNDHSSDRSLRICREATKEIKSLKVFSSRERAGKTLSVIRGIGLASGRILCFMDADYQYDPADLPRLVREIRKGSDICAGIRRKREDSFSRVLFSLVFNSFNRIMFNIRVRDINCGMKAFSREAFKKITIRHTRARWFLDTELLARAAGKGMRISQVVINHFQRKGGRSKINMARIVFETLGYGLVLKMELLLN